MTAGGSVVSSGGGGPVEGGREPDEAEDEAYMAALADTEPEMGLCPNCGDAYPITDEWSNTTLCSQRCVTEYLRYVDAPWGTR